MHFTVIDLAVNPVKGFDDVLAYWQSLCGDALAPPWTSVNLLNIPTTYLPYCIVVDIHPTTDIFSYRYYGSGIANLHGFELTNRTLNDLEPPALRDHVLRQYRMVIEARKPMIFATEISVKNGLRLYHLVLRLPLSDDGKTITNILTVEDLGDHRLELHKYYSTIALADRD